MLTGVSTSSTTTSANVQPTPTVEPYIPVPVSNKPVPDMPNVPTAITEPPPASQVEEEADLVISVAPEVEQDLTAGLPLSTQEEPSVKTAAREAISQGVARRSVFHRSRSRRKSRSQQEDQTTVEASVLLRRRPDLPRVVRLHLVAVRHIDVSRVRLASAHPVANVVRSRHQDVSC